MEARIGGSILDLHRRHISVTTRARGHEPHRTALFKSGQRIEQRVSQVFLPGAEPQQHSINDLLLVLIDERFVKKFVQGIPEVIVNVSVYPDLLHEGIGLQTELFKQALVIDNIRGGIIIQSHNVNVTRISR